MSSIGILKSIYLYFVLMYQLGYKRINPSLKISLVISKFSLFWWFFVIFTPKFSISLKFCIVSEIYVFLQIFFFAKFSHYCFQEILAFLISRNSLKAKMKRNGGEKNISRKIWNFCETISPFRCTFVQIMNK